MDKKLISTKELAEILSLSVKAVEHKREKIAGGVRIGRLWRFDKDVIMARITTGKSIFMQDSYKKRSFARQK